MPYRKLYPSASVAEWKHKGNDREKKIRAIQLINPDMDVREIWAKDEEVDDDDDSLAGKNYSMYMTRHHMKKENIEVQTL